MLHRFAPVLLGLLVLVALVESPDFPRAVLAAGLALLGIEAMFEKEPMATYIVSQICFDADVIATAKMAQPNLPAYWLASLKPNKKRKTPPPTADPRN